MTENLKIVIDNDKPEEERPGRGSERPQLEGGIYEWAKKFIADCHQHVRGDTLVFHRDTFYTWTGAAWREVTRNEIRRRSYDYLDAHDRWWPPAQDWVPCAPNKTTINDFVDALESAARLNEDVEPYSWVDGEQTGQVIPFQNGVLFLDTEEFMQPTPELFNPSALPFDYTTDAPKPTRWLQFLEELWPGDEGRQYRDTLQRMFGYILSTDTSQQKAFMLVGPPRSGKGTIARILTKLQGEGNTANPILKSLQNDFGLSPLIGKPLAIVSDTRLSGKADTAAITENILRITGEDGVTANRKHKDMWMGQLPTRFVILCNSMPDFQDEDGVIMTRFILFRMNVSFLGKEDFNLTETLSAELPGIINWAIEGLRMLREDGRFEQPEASQAVIQEAIDFGDPLGAFIRERCELGAGKIVYLDELHIKFNEWRNDRGDDGLGISKKDLSQRLNARLHPFRTTRTRTERGQVQVCQGIGLR